MVRRGASPDPHAMNGLASIYGRRNKETEALKLHERILEVRQKTSGLSDSKTLMAKHNLGPRTDGSGKAEEGGAATPRGRRDGGQERAR